ncbi:hypothetical protein [uncultured Winogradskyella sp.]|uniref:hypothetical protein n=1 Tax=uncultured Winogradskyella sp. TaxID=395353 RepID=UPI00260706D4|nr:hypothetical protein [uncultured Winogradskyella sp.]
MKIIKRKRKPFFRIFFMLLAIQLVIVLVDAFFAKGDNLLASITEPIITVISLPIGIISPNLPFYSGEGILVSLLFWVLNTAIQAAALYVVYRMFKRLK